MTAMQNKPKNIWLVAGLCSLLLLLPAVSHAEKWNNLTPAQRQLLAPLAKSWDSLEKAEQKSFVGVANAYPQLTPDKQQRLREQISTWAALTPEQRHRAREKFTAFSKVPAERRDEVKRIVREQETKPEAPQAKVESTQKPD